MPAGAPPGSPSLLRESLLQRPITLDEAVIISLENQPQIRARLGECAAAKFRVDQAMSAIMPQFAA